MDTASLTSDLCSESLESVCSFCVVPRGESYCREDGFIISRSAYLSVIIKPRNGHKLYGFICDSSHNNKVGEFLIFNTFYSLNIIHVACFS